MAFYKFGLPLVALLCGLLSVSCQSPEPKEESQFSVNRRVHRQNVSLYPADVEKDGEIKWGYIDLAGKIAIPPNFDDARPFSEGLGVVKIGGLWGAIDANGTMVIQPIYPELASSSDGALHYVSGPNRHGFVDQQGVDIATRTFLGAKSFSEGLAPVAVSTLEAPDGGYSPLGREVAWGYIDLFGNWVIPPSVHITDAYPFYVGVAVVQHKEYRWSEPVSRYLDRNGELTPFYGGSSVTELGLRAYHGDNWAFFDFQGAISRVTHFGLEQWRLKRYSEGLAVVFIPDNGYSYVDTDGDVVIPGPYKEAADFSQGRAFVRDSGGSIRIIDRAGTFLLDEEFEFITQYHESRSVVKVVGDRKFSLLDIRGHFIVRDTIDYPLGKFSEGICPVVIEGRSAYIDNMGNVLWMGAQRQAPN